MFNLIDTNTTLALAQQRQNDLKASFPRKQRRHHPDISTPTLTRMPSRIDVGALSVPAPRESEQEHTAA